MDSDGTRRAWLIFYVDRQRYAVPVSCIEELVCEEAIQAVSLPGMNKAVTGLVRWREQILPRLDLRTVLGLQPMSQQTAELLQTLTQREADHVNWLKELEASVEEDRPFTLATDPHKCAFGKWYDHVRSDDQLRDAFTNRNVGLLRVLNAFDQPHAEIHGIAQEVEALKKQGHREQAHELINKTRENVLSAMVKLFNDARGFIQKLHRSMTIILHHGQDRVCLVIDSIDLIIEVEDTSLETIETPAEASGLQLRVSRYDEDQNLVMHIEPSDLIQWQAAQTSAA
jgi:chemotaxis signal transduction protein